MRVDIEYIKNLLETILSSEHADFRIEHPEIKPLWENDDQALNLLVFHMEILADQGLIESSNNTEGVGFRRLGNGSFTVSIKPLRLTASGHQFAFDLAKPGVFEQLTTTFKELGPAETVKATFRLGAKAFESNLDDLIGE